MPCQPIDCYTCLNEGHPYADCMYKDWIDLKFYTSCGIGDHSLDDFLSMLEKIQNKNNVNILSSVQKCDIIQTKNLQIVTQKGTKTGIDNPKINKIKSK